MICSQGGPMPGILIFAYGSRDARAQAAGGRAAGSRFLAAKECFDVATVLQHRPCPVDIVTLTDSLVITLPATPLRRLMDLDPGSPATCCRKLTENYLGLLEEFEVSVQKSALQRLAATWCRSPSPMAVRIRGVARLPDEQDRASPRGSASQGNHVAPAARTAWSRG